MSNGPAVTSFAREGVTSLPLYSTEASPCAIDLSDNTNLWGAPPAALQVVRDVRTESLSRYPSLYSEPLRDLLLEYVGLGTADDFGVVTGCGSDDVLNSAMCAFGGESASIAFSAPTFSMIPVLARLNGLRPLPVPFTAELDIDAERLVEAGARVTYLCSPNNPTATAASRAAVEYVVRNSKGIVILDEAYAEFAPETFLNLVRESEHLLVTRTFSKAFGLAGLRVGFGVGSRAITRLVSRARGPYKVNAVAEATVRAVLAESATGVDWVMEHARHAVANRERLIPLLAQRGVQVVPSAANFVFAPTPNAVAISRALVARGILVRVVSGLPGNPPPLAAGRGTGLRIGIGPWEMMQPLLDALDEILPCE
jgi:histidinol-phosphate aminotransferase